MFLRILAAFHLDDPGSLKRAIAIVLGGLAVLLLNPFLAAKGLPPVSDTSLELFAGLVATFVVQSAAKAASVAKSDATVEVAKARAVPYEPDVKP
jgi:hypothetical protein